MFGESNEVFNPIVGGTTADDIRTGHVARLLDRAYPGRTTLMKLATVSTLWDYIRRAMPWNAPKSLTTDEVYGVTAYILNLGDIVPDDFVLSDRNIAEVQQRMPNRNGMTTAHALWPGAEFGRHKPDVQAAACMKDCVAEPKVGSFLPAFARSAHGNLAEQNRGFGAQVGAETASPAAAAAAPRAAAQPTAPTALLQQHQCSACHAVDAKLVGPALREIAKKYADRADAVDYLVGEDQVRRRRRLGRRADAAADAARCRREDHRRVARRRQVLSGALGPIAALARAPATIAENRYA